MSGKKAGCGVFGLLGVVSFCALMIGVVGASIFPAALRIPAAFLCPDGTVESVVVRHVSHPEPGTTSVHGVLHCLDASGCSTSPKEFLTLLTLFGLAFAAVAVVLLPLSLLGAQRQRGRRGPESEDGGLPNL